MPGTVGHYNLLERLGEGPLGEVYRARDTRVGRTVALILSNPAMFGDEAARQRFIEDARAASSLSHPNIATLFDVGEAGGRCYLAYEFVGNSTLRQQMTGRPMNPRHALEIAVQLTDALADAHSHGILHRDLRPETVAITGKGSAKVLHFGMAPWTRGGAAASAASPPSPGGLVADGASYMSPEQTLGGQVDARTDVFSLGVIVYEMVTGRHPFAGKTPATTLTNLAAKAPPPASGFNPDLPKDLDATLGRALAKDLDARLQSAVAFSAELRSFLAVLDVRAGERGTSELLPLDDEGPGTARWWLLALAVVAAALALWYGLR